MLEEAVEDAEQLELVRSIGMRSVVMVPMVAASGTPTGVISFVNAESGRVFTEADLELCAEIGRRAGIAVENARLYTERSTIARTLQRALLPPALPEIPGFALATLYRPAGQENWVGGDFYDAYEVNGGWMVVVGDVAGRGAPAASLTAYSRHVLRTAAQLHDDPLDAVTFLNRQLYERPGAALCTLCCVLLRERGADAEATVICAGHPLPFAIRRDGTPEQVGAWGTMLGAWTTAEFPRTTTTLAPGELLVLYTDGVTDAIGETSATATSGCRRRWPTRASPRRRCAGSRTRSWSSSTASRRTTPARSRSGGSARRAPALSSARPRRPSGPWARPSR